MSHLRTLDLNFLKSYSKITNVISLVLLVFGVGLVAYELQAYMQLSEQSKHLQADLLRQKKNQQTISVSAEGKELAPELHKAAVVIDRLAFPWENLFKVLERSTASDVTLLSVQPDLASGVVTLNAEARDRDAMLRYVKRLSADAYFKSVHMVSHQIQQSDPQRPVRFVLSCAWSVESQ